MNDEHRKQLLEQREEIEMMLLMDEYLESEGAMLLKDFEEADKRGEIPEIPEDLDERCRQIIHNSFAKQEQKRTLTRITKYIGKVAVYVLLFLGVASTLILSVDALRIPVLNFFLDRSERATSISLEEPQKSEESEFSQMINTVKGLLPEGYELISSSEDAEGFCVVCFQNAAGNILLIETQPLDATISIDTEDVTPTDMEINGYDALVIEKDGLRVIWFNADSHIAYSVYADALDSTIFWKITYTVAR